MSRMPSALVTALIRIPQRVADEDGAEKKLRPADEPYFCQRLVSSLPGLLRRHRRQPDDLSHIALVLMPEWKAETGNIVNRPLRAPRPAVGIL